MKNYKSIIAFATLLILFTIDAKAQSYLLLKRENWIFKESNGVPYSMTKKYDPIDYPSQPSSKPKIIYRTKIKLVPDTATHYSAMNSKLMAPRPLSESFTNKKDSVIFKNNIYLSIFTPKATYEPKLEPTMVIDTFALSKEKRHGWYFIAGGLTAQAIGGYAFVKMYKPTEIKNVVRVTNRGVSIKTEVNNHTKDNIKAGVVAGGFIVGGLILEKVGLDKLKNVHADANGVRITLFNKSKHKRIAW